MKRKTIGFAVLIPLIYAGCNGAATDESAKYDERRPKPALAAKRGLPREIDDEPSMEKPDNGAMIDSKGTSAGNFRQSVETSLSREGLTVSAVVKDADEVEERIFAEYGAVFLTRAKPPSTVMFSSDGEVLEFQQSAGIASESLGGVKIELQPAAMKALKSAVSEAESNGLKISPRDGEEAGRRSFSKTLDLWNSRLEPALKHWRSKNRLTQDEVERLRGLPVRRQVAEVLELEKRGIYFNTFFNNSILYSVAAPGTSQHLSMLAFDVVEHSNPRIQALMAQHGWFRTVKNDAPHFTYLGYGESELPSLGLKKIQKNGGYFWVPDV